MKLTMNKLQVKIRFNHGAKSENEIWRVIVNEVKDQNPKEVVSSKEYHCADVVFFCHTETTKDSVLQDGEIVDKWHISAINPRSIEILENQKRITSMVIA